MIKTAKVQLTLCSKHLMMTGVKFVRTRNVKAEKRASEYRLHLESTAVKLDAT